MFSYVSIEERIPASHPLRRIRRLADQALDRLNPTFCRLYALEGADAVGLRRLRVRLAAPLKRRPGRLELARARLAFADDGQPLALVEGSQVSSRIGSLQGAELLLELPAEAATLEAGTELWAQLLLLPLFCPPALFAQPGSGQRECLHRGVLPSNQVPTPFTHSRFQKGTSCWRPSSRAGPRRSTATSTAAAPWAVTMASSCRRRSAMAG